MKKILLGIICLSLSITCIAQKKNHIKHISKPFDWNGCFSCGVDPSQVDKMPGWKAVEESMFNDTADIVYEKIGSKTIRDTFKYDKCSCAVFSHLKDNGEREILPCNKLKQGTQWAMSGSYIKIIKKYKGKILNIGEPHYSECGGWGRPSQSYKYDGKEIIPLELFKRPIEK